MCGIVGFVGDWSPEILKTLSNLIVYRGPDHAGEHYDPQTQVGLAMRRLSILDLTGGLQPMPNEDESVWIVFNGEIYNAPELRPQLIAQGHRFQTANSDTECLLHLYEEKGTNMLTDLNGMFAFVIYDRKQQRLFGARDRFGIKPLYYTQPAGYFAFASELKPLLLLPSATRDINRQSLYHYLSLRYIPGQESIFQGIYRLRPAHYFIYELEAHSFIQQRYWRPDPRRREKHSIEEWAEIIHDELRSAIQRWTLSDVPIACSLSGGLDSSAIVGLLSEMGSSKIRTYSLGFQEEAAEAWNELPLARKVAQKWGTEHHELHLTPEVLLADLVRMVWHLDEPYAGGLPSWYIYQFMSKDVKVGLTGTGGDELFGGYGKWRRYEESITSPQGFRQHLRHTAKRLLAKLPGKILGFDCKPALANGRPPAFRRPMEAYGLIYFTDPVKRHYLQPAPENFMDTIDWFQQLYEDSGAYDMRNGIAYVDMQTQLPEEFLLMTDRFSMAHSLEARVPFLDHRFVEQVLSIPPEIRTHPYDLKYLFKRAVGKVLPEELLQAPKRGFTLPDALWLRGKLRPLADRLLSPERLQRQGIFHPHLYTDLVRPHLEGVAEYTDHVWILLMFQLWYTVFLEYGAIEPPSYSWQDLL